MTRMVVAEVRSEHCAYEVVVNGGVLLRSARHDSVTATKLDPMLVEGDNLIEVFVAPLADAMDPRANIELRVHQGEHGRHPGEAGKLLEQRWSQAAAPVEGHARVMSAPLKTNVSHGRWAWQDALPYTGADRPAVEALVAAFYGAVQASDLDAMAAYTQVRDTELARALDVDAGKIVQGERSAIEPFFGQPDWLLAPLPPLSLVPRGGGRLVEVTGPDRTAPIVGGAAGETVELELTVANLAGTWWIVR